MSNPINIVCALMAVVLVAVILASPQQDDPCKPPLVCCGTPGGVAP